MSPTVVKASAYLHHLALKSPDPERLAKFYAETMQMHAERLGQGYVCTGPGRRLILEEGPAKTLGHAAFACRDHDALAEIRARAETEGLRPQTANTPLMADGAFSVIDPDGNTIVFGLAGRDPERGGIKGPIQHLTLATRDIAAIEAFYAGKLGFLVSDYVVNDAGKVMTCFFRSNHEHHSLGCFFQDRQGIDHHSYEAGEWGVIKDWCDHFATKDVQLMWGPGRHGPGNNLFIFIVDPDGNWIEVSAELEVMHDRAPKTWPHRERTLNLWGKGILRA